MCSCKINVIEYLYEAVCVQFENDNFLKTGTSCSFMYLIPVRGYLVRVRVGDPERIITFPGRVDDRGVGRV